MIRRCVKHLHDKMSLFYDIEDYLSKLWSSEYNGQNNNCECCAKKEKEIDKLEKRVRSLETRIVDKDNKFDILQTINHQQVQTLQSQIVDKVSELDSLQNRSIGWVRWAFTLSFHLLSKKQSFEDTLYAVISYGGDVDTNACIVMAMMGAFHKESIRL